MDAGELLGREDELRAVDAFLDNVAEGFAALVLQGEPGIGKTTVWREGVRRADERGFAVLACRPAAAESKLSFSALTDLLEPLPADAFASLPDPQRRALDAALLRSAADSEAVEPRAVAAGVRGVLAELTATEAVLVAVDDTQWLDSPSTRALEFALRRLSDERVGLLTARRPPSSSARARLEMPDGEQLDLGPLSLAAVHELLKFRLGRSLPRPTLLRVHEVAHGNPFYSLEIAREVIEAGVEPGAPLPVPQGLDRLVRRRLGRLSAVVREILLIASALSEPTVSVIAAALKADPSEAIGEAERAGVVELHRERLRFAHPLYAAAIYAAAPREQRRRIHRRLSEVLTNVEERARQLALADPAPSEEVAGLLEQAAIAARRRGAAGAAGGLFADASRLTPASREGCAAERAFRAAEALFDAADTAAARSMLDHALADLPGGATRVRALLQMALIHFYEDGPRPAVEVCRRALEEVGDDRGLEVEVHLHLAFVSGHDLAAARRSARRARSLVEADSPMPDDLKAAAWLEDAWVGLLNGEPLAAAQVEQALRIMPPDGITWPAQRAHADLQSWCKYTDDLLRARTMLEGAVANRQDHGDEFSAAIAMANLAEVECWMGEWQLARAHAEESLRTIEQAGSPLWRAAVLYQQALVAAHLGLDAEARPRAVEGLQLADDARDPWIATLNSSVLGFLELSLGDFAAANTWLSRAASLLEEIGLAEPARFRFHGDQIEAVVGLGELERAVALLDRLQQRATIAPRPWILTVCARSEAMLQAARTELDAALDSLETALREHERLTMPFELGRTLLVKGEIERRAKRKGAAKESLEHALAIFDSLGASLWAVRARDELRRIGLRRAADADLTAGERRVAELAASGLKNREVAAQLFTSPKTVEANLARAYRKLGIHSRAELGARLAAAARKSAQT